MSKTLKDFLKDKLLAFIRENEYFDIEIDFLFSEGIIQTINNWCPPETEDDITPDDMIFASVEVIGIEDDQMEICYREKTDDNFYIATLEFDSKTEEFNTISINEGYLAGMNSDNLLNELFGTSDIQTIIEKK